MAARTSSGSDATRLAVDRAAGATGISERLGELTARGEKGQGSIAFHEISRAGLTYFLAAVREAAEAGGGRRLWVTFGDFKALDTTAAELPTWGATPILIPRLEAAYDIDALPDPEASAERLAALARLIDPPAEGAAEVVLLHHDTLDEDAPSPKSIGSDRLEMEAGKTLDLGSAVKTLEEAGYEKTYQVAERGQFAVRGGILDVFSWEADLPLRAEFFDDELESLRRFEIHSQISVEKVPHAEVLLRTGEGTDFVKIADYLGDDDLIVAAGCPPDTTALRLAAATVDEHPDEAGGGEDGADLAQSDPARIEPEPLGVFEAGDFILQQNRRDGFLHQVARWREDGWSVLMAFNAKGEVERFTELVGADTLAAVDVVIGHVARGFTCAAAKVAVLSDSEIFGRYQTRHAAHSLLGRAGRNDTVARSQVSLKELRRGDLVVHAEYGIGRYTGLTREDGDPDNDEVLEIEYAERARLFVPLQFAHLVTKYIGATRKPPPLSKLGDGRWGKARQRVERSIMDYAGQLLHIQAERAAEVGHAHAPDTKWQQEFEDSFVYRETPDQLRAIQEAKDDMESPRPMDRLVCGDVGFGKTEVAIRAAFKCVMGGKQVAILVPTTVLAEQHYRTFRERMSDYPVKIGLLSRFRTKKQQAETVKGMLGGSVDIVIGTHRLISKDVGFKDLGLVVIDEEQRFGVKHKERFKELFRQVDVLTLSATPIPRTLYLSLMGVRDMSTIETPPPNRHPVQTTVAPYDERAIRSAIDRELDRGGQVFFLHNRVMTIEKTARRIAELCPRAQPIVGHGQMPEGELEDVMHRFIAGEADVLVCTTIIESGVDIPNANTIVIDRADRFGLADLYQLRGRVGRAGDRAYAILMLPRSILGPGEARKRINAIKQYSQLGAGFQIAMRDLEIRGAGNLLGTKQSGHIAAVGFDLYCQLLKSSVATLQGKPASVRVDVSFSADSVCTSEAEWMAHYLSGDYEGIERIPAFIPSDFMAEPRVRILAYRSIAELSTQKELKGLRKEWRDRFGPPPEAVENLLACSALRLAAAHANIASVELKERRMLLIRGGDYLKPGGQFPRLTANSAESRLREAHDLIASLSLS